MLALQGINIAAMFKVIVGINLRILTPLTMALTIILLTDFGRLQSFRFSRYNRSMTMIVLYLSYVTALSFFSDHDLFLPTYGFLYQLAYLITILMLWNNDERFQMDQAYTVLIWSSAAVCLVALVLVVKNAASTGSVYFQGLGRDSEGHYIITRASTASLAFVMLATALAQKGPTVRARIQKTIFLAIAIVVIFLSRRRGIYISSLAAFFYALTQRRKSERHKMRKTAVFRIMFAASLLLAVLLGLLANQSTAEIISRGTRSLLNGISTYFGSDNDVAAAIRYERLQRIPYEYLVESAVPNFLLGNGYMTEWLDVPIVQAFNDLGIVGGIVFLLAFLVFPIRCLFYQTDTAFVRFAQLYSISSFLSIVSSGVPYGSIFFPVALLVYSVKLDQERKSMNHSSNMTDNYDELLSMNKQGMI